jgi:Zn-dependent protease with chaperone function
MLGSVTLPSVVAREPAVTGRREQQARRVLDDVRHAPEQAVSPGERAAAFLVAVAVHLVTVALVVGGVLLVVLTWFDVVAFVAGVFLATAGLAVLPRMERPPPGQRLRFEEVPRLHGLVDDVADALVAPRVQVVVLTGDFNIGYAASGLTQQRVLVLGLPFWAVLEGQERVAVLAHEFGHAVSGDPSTSIVIGSALQTLRRWLAMLRPDKHRYANSWARGFLTVVDPVLFVLSLVPRGALAVLSGLVRRDQQRCEYLSDVYATEVAGRSATARALEKTRLAGVVDGELARMSQHGGMRDVWLVVRQRTDDALARDRKRLLDEAEVDHVSLDGSHPPTTMRLELVGSLPDHAPAVSPTRSEWQAIDDELAPLAGALGRALVGRYR